MGAAAWSLTVWARAYCDAGYDAGGRFELNFLLPLTVAAETLVALLTHAIARRLARHAPKALRATLPLLLVLLTTAALAWYLFATRGTLADYPSDSGLCPPTNLPPQWPTWLPA